MKNFIDWIQQEHDVTLTDSTHMFDIGFTHGSSKDGYDLYLIVNDRFNLEYGVEESIIQEEHNLYGVIREEIEDRGGATIYLENLEEWIEYLVDEFPDFEEDEDWDEE